MTRLMAAVTFCFVLNAYAGERELDTVDSVNLEMYQGKWHQLALIPNSFQKHCLKNTTADYTLMDDGTIQVINSCDEEDGERDSSEGRARVNPDFEDSSKLEVTFAKFIGWLWFAAGDYWVTYLDDDYQNVIVGHPDYEYGWILSRKNTLSEREYRKLSDTLTARGYDTCHFVMSETPGQKFEEGLKLCEYF